MKRFLQLGLLLLICFGAVAQDISGCAGLKSPDKTKDEATEIITDMRGVDFTPYIEGVEKTINEQWRAVIPKSARKPELKQGKVVIRFYILKDGRVAGMQLVQPSGDTDLDRAAWSGIAQSNPFPALPAQFTGPYLGLKLSFFLQSE